MGERVSVSRNNYTSEDTWSCQSYILLEKSILRIYFLFHLATWIMIVIQTPYLYRVLEWLTPAEESIPGSDQMPPTNHQWQSAMTIEGEGYMQSAAPTVPSPSSLLSFFLILCGIFSLVCIDQPCCLARQTSPSAVRCKRFRCKETTWNRAKSRMHYNDTWLIWILHPFAPLSSLHDNGWRSTSNWVLTIAPIDMNIYILL